MIAKTLLGLALSLGASITRGAICTRRPILVIQPVLFDISNHRFGDQVSDRHISTTEQTDLGGRDVVLDKLLDDPDVVLPGQKCRQGFVYIGSGPLFPCWLEMTSCTTFGGHLTSTIKAPKFLKM